MQDLLDISYMIESLPSIAKGVPVSLAITGVAFAVGILIGLAIALIRIYKIPFLKSLAGLYVSFMRGTPLLVQIFLSYYGIPLLLRYINSKYNTDFDISEIPAIYFIYTSFSLNVGAYLSETIRASILSVPRGQMEAAYSIGMTTAQALKRIILPQATAVALPNVGNQFIALLKDTSLAFAASVPEIIGEAKIIAGRTSKFFEVYIVAALLYWLICIVFERVVLYLEKAYMKHERGVAND